MKGPRQRLPSRKRSAFTCFIAATLLIVLQTPALAATLSDKNSAINLSLGSSAGMTDWLVDGNDSVNQQWFWFRIGNSGPQFDVSTIGSPIVTTLGTKTLTVLYSNSLYGASITYTLSGSTLGTGHSALTEAINFYNYQTNASLDLHFFM